MPPPPIYSTIPVVAEGGEFPLTETDTEPLTAKLPAGQ